MRDGRLPLEISKPEYHNDTSEVFLILGGGVSALCAAIAIRERNSTAGITIAGSEHYLPYSRPMLTKSPLLRFDMSAYTIHDEDWYSANRINVLGNHTATAIDSGKKTVSFEGGGVQSYDKCIYALGAESIMPSVAGADHSTVVTVRDFSDISRLRRAMPGSERATVIGGGAIGLEIAWQLKKSGLEVVVIESSGTLMERVLDPDSARLLESAIIASGIGIFTNARITEIKGHDGAKTVFLDDGTFITTDIIIASAGVKPNTGLAGCAGLKTGEGVLVNKYMETNIPDIYACGDCAEFDGASAGSWPRSQAQGYTAGANAAGDALEYVEDLNSTMLRVADTCLFSIGDMGKKNGVVYDLKTECGNTGQNQEPRYFPVNERPYGREFLESYSFSEGVLKGVTLIGDLTRMLQVKEAIALNSQPVEQSSLTIEAVL